MLPAARENGLILYTHALLTNMDKVRALKRCEELIKSFDPVTHSIDTHISENIDKSASVSRGREKRGGQTYNPRVENTFVQQVVYGWHKERKVLEVGDVQSLIVIPIYS